jgi:cytochrome c oxidase subunit II
VHLGKRLYSIGVMIFLSFLAPKVFANWGYNMPVGVTPISQDMYWLHMTVFWICVAIGVIVFGMLAYALIMHRKSRGHQASDFHEHPVLEIVWAVIPFLILVAMAVPATIVLFRAHDESNSDITIKVTGFQWKWRYEYLDHGISFYSNLSTPQDQIHNREPKGALYLREVDNPLVVPIHKKIRILVTANDVIHSWWVAELGIKTDAIPGFIHETWARIDRPGIYRGQCAELCGVNHAFMPIVVVAVTEEDFAKWIKEHMPNKAAAIQAAAALTKTWTKDELLSAGKQIYETTCSVCHQLDGSGLPPTFPAMRGSKTATGPVAEHISTVLNGRKGTAMQAFGNQLSDQDIAAVITYERNSFGNDDVSKYGKDAGGIVQPATVETSRGKQ